jgi:hypothetical protein
MVSTGRRVEAVLNGSMHTFSLHGASGDVTALSSPTLSAAGYRRWCDAFWTGAS